MINVLIPHATTCCVINILTQYVQPSYDDLSISELHHPYRKKETAKIEIERERKREELSFAEVFPQTIILLPVCLSFSLYILNPLTPRESEEEREKNGEREAGEVSHSPTTLICCIINVLIPHALTTPDST